MSTSTDEPRALRDEDAFDVAALHAWLAGRVDGLGDALPEVRQFAGGASNLTYLLRYPSRDLVLRRPLSAGRYRLTVRGSAADGAVVAGTARLTVKRRR